ncbi:PhzF family phenazine biosynthesis protein [Halorubraceae archaeon YAN]|nr:PhzF family phenazine biosynthesis protein [Halorubraceae archaeon YAN]
MNTRRFALVDAFTETPLSGNAAGVVPDGSGLSDEQMQAIARELSVSETAFLFPSEDADRKIRYFTPTQEVDLCGHATVATHALLATDDTIETGTQSLETNVGVLSVEITASGMVWMTQAEPSVTAVSIDYEALAAALGIEQAALTDVGEELPIARASTGLPFLMVPVSFLQPLGNADPDMDAIASLSTEHDVAGVYAFTFDTLDAASTLHARMFAPASGVPEDPVTGTASGACGAYLEWYGALDSFVDPLQFEQGHFINRGGHAHVDVQTDETTGLTTVRVGGHAVTAADGTLTIPDMSEDEIIEA